MIVIYMWKTTKSGGKYRRVDTRWRGVFLFGFIPLFIWVKSKSWTE